MSNLANYSPHNKSFKFICFQNQAYHEANVRNMRPCVRTNIRYKRIPNNPQNGNMSEFLNGFSVTNSSRMNQSYASLAKNTELDSSQVSLKSLLKTDRRVIHKNASFEKFQRIKVASENKDMVERLLNTSCQVIKNKRTKSSFQKHLKYRDIRKVYDQKNTYKQKLVIPYERLLCPTLSFFKKHSSSDFNKSFVETSPVFVDNTDVLKGIDTTKTTRNSSIRKSRI